MGSSTRLVTSDLFPYMDMRRPNLLLITGETKNPNTMFATMYDDVTAPMRLLLTGTLNLLFHVSQFMILLNTAVKSLC